MMVVAKYQGKDRWRSGIFPWACDLTRKDGELVNCGNVYEALKLEMGTHECSGRCGSSRQMALPMTASPPWNGCL